MHTIFAPVATNSICLVGLVGGKERVRPATVASPLAVVKVETIEVNRAPIPWFGKTTAFDNF